MPNNPPENNEAQRRPAIRNAGRHDRLAGRPLRRHVLISLSAAIVALLITTAIAISDPISGVERAAFQAVNTLPDALEWPLWMVMQLGAAFSIAASAVIALLVSRRARPAADLLVAGSAAWTIAKLMKAAVARGRPESFLHDVNLRGSFAVSDGEGLGFPSGHAAVAFALAVAIFPYLSVRTKVAAISLATIVAISRLYFGAHFPLDAVGGAAVGVACGALIHLIMDLLARQH